MSFRGMYGTDYEQRAREANISEELAFAIEQICDGTIDDDQSEAYLMWSDGAGVRESELIENIPTGCGEEDGDELSWAGSVYAVFSNGKWARAES